MARRKPLKHAKYREDYTATDLTSDDIMYTTESVGINPYETGSYTSYDTFGGRRYETYDSGDPRTYDSYGYDDQDTSFISYEETKRDRKYSTSPESPTGQISGGRRYSPTYRPSSDAYSNLVEEDGVGRKGTKQGRSPEKDNRYSVRHDSKIDKNMQGKRRRNNDYLNYSEKEDMVYALKPKKHKDGNFEFETIHEEFDDRSVKKNRFRTMENKKDYQVYAYNEPKQHDLFRNKKGESKATLLSPEVDVKRDEYPVLAFKVISPKENALDKESDTIYLPVLEVNKKTKTYKTISYHQKSPNERGTQKQMGNFQVYAANLNNQKNIFQAYSESSNQKTGTENDGKDAEKSNKIVSQAQEEASGINLSGFPPFSPSSDVPQNTKLTKDDNTSGKKDMQTDVTMKDNKSIVNYQVNVDIDKDNKNLSEDKKSKSTAGKSSVGRKSNILAEIELKQINDDPLRDDFPVTKDYIKVNENIPGQNQPAAGSEARSMSKYCTTSGDPPQSPLAGDNKASPDGKVEDSTKSTRTSRFTALYGEPMKGPNQSNEGISSLDRKSRLEPVAGIRQSQIANTPDIWKSVIHQKSSQDNKKVGATQSRKSLANRQGLEKISSVPSKDKQLQQENNQRLSAIGGMTTSIKIKPLASGTNVNQSAAEQNNWRSSRVEGSLAPYDVNSLGSGKRPNQTVIQENDQHVSVIGGKKTIDNNMRPIGQQDSWRTSKAGSGPTNASGRQTLTQNNNEIGGSEKGISNIENVNEQLPLNNEQQNIPSSKQTKMNIKSLTTALLTASRIKPNDRSHIPSSQKKLQHSKSLLGPSSRKSKEGQDKRSEFVHSVEPTVTLYKQEQRTSQAGSPFVKPSRSRLSVVQTKSKSQIATGKKSKSIISNKLFRSKSKDKSKNARGKKSGWNIFRKKDKDVSEEETIRKQNDYSALYSEHYEKKKNESTEQKANEEKPCECVTKYIILIRECLHFFLGSSLHEQVMNVLKNI